MRPWECPPYWAIASILVDSAVARRRAVTLVTGGDMVPVVPVAGQY